MQRPEPLPRGWSMRLAALLAGSAIIIGLLLTSSVGTVFAQSTSPSASASAAASVAASAAPAASAAASGGVLGATGSSAASAPTTSTLPSSNGPGQTGLLMPLLLLVGVFVAGTVLIAPRVTRRR